MAKSIGILMTVVAILGVRAQAQAGAVCPTSYDCAVSAPAPFALGVTGSGEPNSTVASIHFDSSGAATAIITRNVNATFDQPAQVPTGTCSVAGTGAAAIGTLSFAAVAGPVFNFVSVGGNPPAELRFINVPGTIVEGLPDETVVLGICKKQ